jgi:hypothetical protein
MVAADDNNQKNKDKMNEEEDEGNEKKQPTRRTKGLNKTHHAGELSAPSDRSISS